MPDAIITSTESTFGTISGTFLETGATIQGTITGIVAGTLDGSVGVPGVGVPTGGTAGQVLAKIDGTNYNTEWVDQSGGVTSVVAPLSLTDGTLSIDESVWIEAPAVAATDGQVPAWDAATSRPVWIDNSARSLFLVGVNKSGSTIPKGAAVYVSGGQGGTPIISLAKADAESTSSQTIGVTTQAIANNAQGNVVVGGAAMKLDTSAYADGQILYLSPTVAGGFVTSLPTQPYHGVVIGYVTRSNNSNGVIEVAIQNYQELRELSDVLIGVKADGDLLAWDAVSGLWKNKTAAALGLATQSFVTGQGYITSAALAPYLLSSTAASVYQTQAAMSAYLTTSAAAAGYYPLTGNPSNFLTSAALAGYATESWVTGQGYITSAALTPYLLIADAEAAFYPLTGNPSNFIDASALTGYATQSWVTSQGYITSAALAGYATESWVTSQGYLTSAPVTSVAGKTGAVTLAAGDISGLGTLATVNDAPSDGSQYARKDGAWAVVSSPTQYITSVSSPLSVTSQNLSIDLSAYATQSFVTSQGYITSAALTPYLTTSLALSTFQTISGMSAYATLASPALTGNPTAPTPATADNDTSIATTAFVKAQGYLTSAPVTSVAGRTGAVTLSTSDISGLGTMATQSASAVVITGGTMAGGFSGVFTATASTTTNAGLRITPGVAPSAPVNGDVWTTTNDLLVRLNGVTETVAEQSWVTAQGYLTSAALTGYAPLASPALTGTPTAPTASAGTSTTQLATTAFVTTADNLKANLASPAFTGTPTAPTATAGTNTTQIATTAFVTAAVPAAATHTQAVQFASTTAYTKVIDASSQVIAPSILCVWPSPSNYNGTATVGTGAAASLHLTGYTLFSPNAGVAGSARVCHGNVAGDLAGMLWGGTNNTSINFGRRVSMSFRFSQFPSSPASVTRVLLGKIHGTAVGDLTSRGIGVKYVPTASTVDFYLQVHDGTTLTNVLASTQYAGGVADLEVVSDGAGNAVLYLNGVQVASSNAAPNGATGTNATVFAEIESTASTTNKPTALIGRLFVNSLNF